MMLADFFKVNMNNNKKRKMVALKVLETSGVDHPAHLEEGWIVMKSANATEAPVSEEVEAMDEALEQAYIERVVELEKAVQERDEKIASLAKEYGEMMAEEEEDEEEMDEEETMKSVLKSLPEPVREMLEKAQGEAAVAREELRKERQERRNEEFVAKAAEWNHLTIDAKEFGPALARLSDIDANLSQMVEKAMSGANAQAESASIFDEIGRPVRSDDNSAYARVETMAKAAVASGEFTTLEQAIAGVVVKNPDLYAAYRAESR
jgi:chromosome segregation ATPase